MPVAPNWWGKRQQSPHTHKEVPLTSVKEKPQNLFSESNEVGAEPPTIPLRITHLIETPNPMLTSRVQTPPVPVLQQSSASQPTDEAKSITSGSAQEEAKYNIIHYDPELHWCRVCNVFPRTAKEFLNHLHAPDHKQNLAVSAKCECFIIVIW